jgi:hypothetical protein
MPDHGLGEEAGTRAVARRFGQHRIETGPAGGPAASRWVLTVYGADGPEVRSRRQWVDGEDRVVRYERLERQRLLRYVFEPSPRRLAARRSEPVGEAAARSDPTGGELPPGLVLLHVPSPGDGPLESPGIVVRLESRGAGPTTRTLEAEFPRALLQRLVRGREVDPTPGQPLPGLAPLPEALGPVSSVMLLPDAERWRAPWEVELPLLAGEEDPLRLARALNAWWAPSEEASRGVVVGVDRARSLERWATAPRPGEQALLLLPRGGFVGPMSSWRTALAEAWDPDRIVEELPDDSRAALIVLVSAEPPALFAARLRELAREERMRGRLLAAWCLAGPVREDLARSLIDEGQLAGLGLAPDSLVARRRTAETIEALGRAVAAAAGERRVEQLSGAFLWHF